MSNSINWNNLTKEDSIRLISEKMERDIGSRRASQDARGVGVSLHNMRNRIIAHIEEFGAEEIPQAWIKLLESKDKDVVARESEVKEEKQETENEAFIRKLLEKGESKKITLPIFERSSALKKEPKEQTRILLPEFMKKDK